MCSSYYPEQRYHRRRAPRTHPAQRYICSPDARGNATGARALGALCRIGTVWISLRTPHLWKKFGVGIPTWEAGSYGYQHYQHQRGAAFRLIGRSLGKSPPSLSSHTKERTVDVQCVGTRQLARLHDRERRALHSLGAWRPGVRLRVTHAGAWLRLFGLRGEPVLIQ